MFLKDWKLDLFYLEIIDWMHGLQKKFCRQSGVINSRRRISFIQNDSLRSEQNSEAAAWAKKMFTHIYYLSFFEKYNNCIQKMWMVAVE